MADTTIRATAQTQESLVPTFTATIGGVEQLCVDARTLHAHLKSGYLFANWINARIQKYAFEQGKDYELASVDSEAQADDEGFFQNSKKPSKGNDGLIFENSKTKTQGRGGDRRSKDFRISLDMAKELSMVESNEQGRAARRYFINMERIAIQAIKDQLAQALEAKTAIDYTRISPAQAQALSELVIAETKRTGKHYKTVWGAFNRHFQVNTYTQLPASQFDEACKWIGGKRIAAKTAAPAPDCELPNLNYNLHHELTTGQCAPKPLTSAITALVQQMSWKLAAEAQVSILQFLERFVSYHTNDSMRDDVPFVTRLLDKLTLSHVLAHRYFSEVGRLQMLANTLQEAATTCANNIRQRMGTIYA